MTTINQGEELRAKVFEICENLYKNNEKINRDVVREKLGGGSFSTICPLIKEWRISRFVQSQTHSDEKIVLSDDVLSDNNEITVQDQETYSNEIILSESSSIEEVEEMLYATSSDDEFLADDDMSNVMKSGQEKAYSLLVAQEVVASHYFQNPNELPEELRRRLKEVRKNFTQGRRTTALQKHNSQNMIDLVKAQLKKPTNDGLELIG
jgi:hypothetical protein